MGKRNRNGKEASSSVVACLQLIPLGTLQDSLNTSQSCLAQGLRKLGSCLCLSLAEGCFQPGKAFRQRVPGIPEL